jgi:7,8-dihydroneopterin aldolase/epimerase/oxygenase
MDKVFIDHLEVYCTIGVYEWEKQITQKLVLDLEMDFDTQAAGEQDEMSLALDYSAVSTRVTQMISAHPIGLVEAVAEQTAQLLLTEFPILRVKVRVTKLGAVVNARGVGVEIIREA